MRPLVGSHRRLGGVHWAVGWGSPEKKLGAGGGGREGGGRRFGRWWLAAQGVEFDDKLEALDFVSNGWKI